jgi:hypothetical protein
MNETGPTTSKENVVESAESAEEPQAKPLGGTRKPLADMLYPKLYDFSVRLGRIRDWDARSEFAGVGLICLGAGAGGLVAEERLTGTIAVFLVLGLALFVGSLFIRRASAESVSHVKEDFDRALSEYEVEDPEIKKTREHYESLKPKPPETRKEHVEEFFNLGKYS